MKRTLYIAAAAIVFVATTHVSAQSEIDSLETFRDGFQDFSDEFARSLPMNSNIGLNWSDAYIGQLLPIPSLGVGVTTGVTTIPTSVFDDLADDLGIEVSGGIDDLPSVGVPLPGYAFEARVGGIVLPFDVGLKFGTIGSLELGDVEAEYTNFGIDLRYAVLEGGVLPKVSVGVGYSYLAGRVATPLGAGDTTIAGVSDGTNTYNLAITDPELEFEWTSNVFDFTVQASKSFVFVEPHIGLGAAIGSSTTDAGLSSEVSVVNTDGSDPGISVSDIESISGVDISSTRVSLDSDVTTFSVRVFGGTSFNITVFRLDLGLMYNFTSGSMGGTLGARFQI